MEVYYNKNLLKNNDFLKPIETQKEPIVKLNVEPLKFYTLIMNDPDAVSGNYIHWTIINISNNNIETGDIIIPYKGPAPPPKSGIHRYNFELYLQDGENNDIKISQERSIEMNIFREKLSLSSPIFKINFLSKNESEYGGRKQKRKSKRKITKKFRKTRRIKRLFHH